MAMTKEEGDDKSMSVDKVRAVENAPLSLPRETPDSGTGGY